MTITAQLLAIDPQEVVSGIVGSWKMHCADGHDRDRE